MSLLSAYNALSTIFGYVRPRWGYERDGEALQAAAETACESAEEAASSAEALLDRRKLDPAGSGGLAGAIAAASEQVAAAKAAAKEAAAKQRALEELLAQNRGSPGILPDLLPPIRTAVGNAGKAVTAASEALGALEAAQLPTRDWHAARTRLEGPVTLRLGVLTKAKGESATTELRAEAQRIALDLASAQAITGGAWTAERIGGVTKRVSGDLEALERRIATAESGGGVDPAELRAAALTRYDRIVEQSELGKVTAEALLALQETNPGAKRQHLEPVLTPIEGERDRLHAALRQTADPAEIATALETSLSRFREALGDLAGQIASTDGLGAVGDKVGEALATEKAAARFEEAKGEVETALQDLRNAGNPRHVHLGKQLQDIVSATYRNGNYKRANETTLPRLLREINETFESHHNEVEPKLNLLKERLEKLGKQLGQAEKQNRAPTVKPLIASIRANLAEAENILDCEGNLEAAEPALGILDEVERMLADFDKSASAFATLSLALGRIDTLLASPELKPVPEGTLAELRSRATTLKSPDNGLALEEFRTEIAALTGAIEAQIEFGRELTSWRGEAARRQLALADQFGIFARAVAAAPPSSFPGGKRPNPAAGKLKLDIDQLKSRIGLAVELDGFAAHKSGWEQLFTEASELLAEFWDGTLKDLAGIENDAGHAERAEQRIAEVKERRKQLETLAKGYRSAVVQARGNLGEYQLLMTQLKGLASAIETDPDAADAQLDDIEERLKQVRGTPQFETVIARQIGQVPAGWEGALNAVKDHLATLKGKVEIKAAGTPFEPALGAIADQMTGALAAFRADAFTALAGTLAAPDPTGAQRAARRTAREEGLRIVKQYQALLMGDPLYQHLQNNPFGTPLFGEVARFLDRVELELLRVAT